MIKKILNSMTIEFFKYSIQEILITGKLKDFRIEIKFYCNLQGVKVFMKVNDIVYYDDAMKFSDYEILISDLYANYQKDAHNKNKSMFKDFESLVDKLS